MTQECSSRSRSMWQGQKLGERPECSVICQKAWMMGAELGFILGAP